MELKEWLSPKEVQSLTSASARTVQRKIDAFRTTSPDLVRKDKNLVFVHRSILQTFQAAKTEKTSSNDANFSPNLQDIVQVLQKELESKNTQIDALLERMREVSILLAREQETNLQLRQQLALAAPKSDSQPIPKKDKKRTDKKRKKK